MFARLIASSLPFLAGYSLVLGQFPQLRPRAFVIRFARCRRSRADQHRDLVAFPQSFIFFGFFTPLPRQALVALAFSEIAGRLFPFSCTAAAFAASPLSALVFFDIRALVVGLSEAIPVNDYVPLLPWVAPFLLASALEAAPPAIFPPGAARSADP